MTPDELREQSFDDGDVMGQIRQLVHEHYGNLHDETLQRMISGLHLLYIKPDLVGVRPMLTGTKDHLAQLDKHTRIGLRRQMEQDGEVDPLFDDLDFQPGDRVTKLASCLPGTVMKPVDWSPPGLVLVNWDHVHTWPGSWTHMRPGQLRKVDTPAPTAKDFDDDPMEQMQYKFDGAMGLLRGFVEELDNSFDLDRPVLESLIRGARDFVEREDG